MKTRPPTLACSLCEDASPTLPCPQVKEEKEAEAARKLRYPIADCLLKDEPPLEPPLPPWPTPKFGLNLPPDAQRLAGTLLSVRRLGGGGARRSGGWWRRGG